MPSAEERGRGTAPGPGHENRPPLLSIVLPTYCEAGNIGGLIHRIAAALEGVEWEIVVVDDRSPDGTAARAREAGVAYGRVRVIERQPPAGLTASIAEGVEEASGRFVAWMDCDLSHPPELLPDLLAAASEEPPRLAIASRYVTGGRDARDTFTRFYSRVINALATRLVHPSVLDYTTGYVVGPRATIRAIGFRGDYGEYCIELLGVAAQNGVAVAELPYTMVLRVEGESKTVADPIRFVRRGLRYLGVCARLGVRRLRGALGGG